MALDTPLFDPDAGGVFADRFTAPDVTPSRPTPFALAGVPFVRLVLQGIYGTLTIGPSTVPIRLSPPVDGVATIDVGPGKLTLDAIFSVGAPDQAWAAAVDPRAILPASLAAAVGGAAVAHVRVRVDLTGRRLTAVGLDVVGDQPWTLMPGRLAVTDLSLSVNVHSHGAEPRVTGALTGTLILGGSKVPVVAVPVVGEPPGRGDSGLDSDFVAADPVMAAGTVAGSAQAPVEADATWWSVAMDSVGGVSLGALSDLAGLLDDDGMDSLLAPALIGHSPPEKPLRDSPADPAFSHPAVLTDLAIRVAPDGTVDSVAITVDIGSSAAADGSLRRTAFVDRRRIDEVDPSGRCVTSGGVQPGPPAR